MATVIVLAVIAVAVFIAVRSIVKNKKNGKCCGCSHAGDCQKRSKK